MESTHQGLVVRPLASKTNQGLIALDPNPGTQLRKTIRELNWKIICCYPIASLLFMYLYRPLLSQ